MSIADKLTLLASSKEALRIKLGLPESLPFSEYYKLAIRKPFEPSDLFIEGKQGVWYDPSDMSTLFQDVAGTIPVTKDGDPVALMRDKSGNNNHAMQTVSAARPVYKTDGILHWLDFDGTDDRLEWENRVRGTSVAIACSSLETTYGVLGGGANGTETGYLAVGSAGFRYRTSTADIHVFTEAQAGTIVCSMLRENNGDVYAWRDGKESTSILNKTSILLKYISPGNVSPYTGRVYGVVVSENLITRQQRDELEMYLANKAGVTL